ncbi:MAG: PqqD family protein [Anaerolineae bacterium]
MAQESARYRRNPDYIFRKIVDELVLVPITQNVADMDAIYTMNPVGASIWEKLESEPTLGELQEAILGEFDADPEVVAADLVEFLAELEAAGAVRKV